MILSSVAILLVMIFTVCGVGNQSENSPSLNSKNKPGYQEKKAAIIPIVVIGGLRFFRKAFQEK